MSQPLDMLELLPHRPPMVLLTRVVGRRDDLFVAEVDITAQSHFYADGGVPSYVGIEYMAQTVAAFNGLEGREQSGSGGAKAGFLLGTREYLCATSSFKDGARLTVRARKTIHQADGLSSLACRILDSDGAELASAQLSVFEVADLKAALKGQRA